MVYLHPKLIDLVAQLVEHLPFKERVLGSSPSPVTKLSEFLISRIDNVIKKTWREVYPERCRRKPQPGHDTRKVKHFA